MNNTTFEPCPWCESQPEVIVDTLYENGMGYIGQYEVKVKCTFSQCPARPAAESFTTLYGDSLTEAGRKAIQSWNSMKTKKE